MYFRLISKVSELVIVPEADIEVDVDDVAGVVLVRRVMEDGSLRDPYDTDTEGNMTTLVVTGFEKDVPPDLVALLTTFSEGRVPEGCQHPTQWVTYGGGPIFHGEGFAVEGSMPRLSWFPEPMQVLVEDLEKSASDAGRRVVDLIRWRRGKLSGSQSPVLLQQFEWSTDGKRWFPMPCEADIHEDERLGIVLAQDELSDVQAMAAEQVDIPFAHVLLREAWDLRTTNPRSSILLGVAAAEIGLKQAIKTLVPESSYLVEMLVLPQLADLLKNYVPLLPAKKRLGDAPPSIPKWVRKEVWEGVQNRNRLAHRPIGATEVVEELRFENLSRLLRAVHDLLVLLDFYCGKEWAAELLSEESRSELDLPPLPPPEATFPAKYVSSRRTLHLWSPELGTE